MIRRSPASFPLPLPKESSSAEAGVRMLQLDVDSDQSVNDCVNGIIDKTGSLHVLVNNAGYALTGAIEEDSPDEATSQFETHCFGTVRLTNAVLPIMRKHGSGQIINMSSIAATIP